MVSPLRKNGFTSQAAAFTARPQRGEADFVVKRVLARGLLSLPRTILTTGRF
jgi:hypothetical protein